MFSEIQNDIHSIHQRDSKISTERQFEGTKEGDVIKLNLLTLAAFDSNLSKSLLSMKDDKEEDIVIITEYSWLDLISLQHFCMKGLFPLPPEEVQNDPNTSNNNTNHIQLNPNKNPNKIQ